MRTRADDDEDDYYEEEPTMSGHVVIEQDRPPATFTGLFNAAGEPIYRIPVPKPSIGFITKPGEEELFNLDPDEDFYYGTLDEEGASNTDGDDSASAG